MDKQELALEYKHNGNNCAQAVMCAFADESGKDIEELRALGAAFGSGMGCMEGTCGALVGAEIILGLKKYEGRGIHKDAAGLLKSFQEMCGATICKDLKGRDTGVVICSCDDCVKNAAAILEKALQG